MAKIIGIVLCAIFLTIQADEDVQPIDVIYLNGCSLNYTNTSVHDKPDNILTIQTDILPAICRIQKNQHESTDNYEVVEVKYYKPDIGWKFLPLLFRSKEYRPNEIGPAMPDTIQIYDLLALYRLSFDARTQSLLYFDRDSDGTIFIRKRLNDTQLIEKVVLKDRYQLTPGLVKNDYVIDFAYDWVTENLFIQDRRSIAVVNLKKPSQAVNLVTTTSKRYVSTFVIHPNAGYLFYLEITLKFVNNDPENLSINNGYYQSIIYRTHLDGSNKTQIGPIFRTGYERMSNLVIDYHTDRLYWCAPDTKVLESSNLDGNDIKTVLHGCVPDVTQLWTEKLISFDKKYIYYFKGIQIHRLDKETLKEDENFSIVTGTGDIHQIMIYDPEAQKITSDNPCSIDNGGCEQYCLAMPSANATKGLDRKCVSV